jgi:flagellar assembly factor FliW
MNRTIQSRFGEIEYDSAATLCFPDGLIGFENLRHFIVMPNIKEGPLFWVQSVEDPDVAFVLTDPTNFFLDYNVQLERRERVKLGIDEDDETYALSVVTVHRDKSVTLNLQAPILFSPSTNQAIQIILEKGDYQTRTPLPVVEPVRQAK